MTDDAGEVLSSRDFLRQWLNKSMRIELSDGRVLVGTFLCTDASANVILGNCTETLEEDDQSEPRVLGLAMVPGKHIKSIKVDDCNKSASC